MPLARAQRQFASAGQMLALDPFLGPADEATIGGIIASGDSGPLRHRYGAPRDLILGMTVALSDGTIARSGGKVIKNVAGYDLGKLFSGSFGTLGLILSVNVRLHPLPAATATALGVSADPERTGGGGARARGGAARARGARRRLAAGQRRHPRAVRRRHRRDRGPRRSRALMREAGLERRRGHLRRRRAVGAPARRAARARAERSCASLRARARSPQRPRGQPTRAGRPWSGGRRSDTATSSSSRPRSPSWSRASPTGRCTSLLDAPPGTLSEIERWGPAPPAPALALMRRVKARFDPAGTCNPGAFVGGI